MNAKFLSSANAALILIIAAVILLFGAGCGGPTFAAGSGQVPPPPPPTPEARLGNPTGLTAAPGSNPGAVDLRWTPAANAAIHLVYLIKTGDASGRFWPAAPGDASSATVTGLQIGHTYYFIVIAGRPGTGGASYQWSQWSNWMQAAPAQPVLPPPPTLPAATIAPTPAATITPTPGTGRRQRAEIEGTVIAIDAGANTFTVTVTEYEHFGGSRPSNPMTVDYSAVESVENWLRPGRYIEAEGSYDPATNTLRAHEVESHYRDDDDHDDDDHDDDDD